MNRKDTEVGGDDEHLELSVVVQDLQFDPIDEPVVPKWTPSAGRKSARVSVLDEPDDMYTLSRREELNAKTSWFVPCTLLLAAVVRAANPYGHPGNGQAKWRGLLAPGPLFTFTLIPVLIAHTCLAAASLSKLLRGTRLIDRGISWIGITSALLSCVWLWGYSEGFDPSALVILSGCDALLSLWMLARVRRERQEALEGIWLHRLRWNIRLRDYWFVEVPALIQLTFAGATLWYSGIAASSKQRQIVDPSRVATPQMASLLLGDALTSIALMTCFCTFLYGWKGRGGDAAVGIMVSWFLADQYWQLAGTPDTIVSPQLTWVSTWGHLDPIRRAIAVILAIAIAATLMSLSLQAVNGVAAYKLAKHQNDTCSFLNPRTASQWRGGVYDWATEPPTTAAPKRRPSEFLMRALSSMSDSNTPMPKFS